MPIFVEWEWKKGTESLLAIFHFYDDFSKPNLRLMKYDKGRLAVISSPIGYLEPKKAWMTWAPSHPEMGLLMELLSYANIINGLKPTEKRKLWIELEGKKALLDRFGYPVPENILGSIAAPHDIKREIGKDKKIIVYDVHGEGEPLRTCVELCPEYIDYLKKVLKPYIKG